MDDYYQQATGEPEGLEAGTEPEITVDDIRRDVQEAALTEPAVKLTTPPPPLHPQSIADLFQKATEAAGDHNTNQVITDVRVTKVGWDARAIVQVKAFGGKLGVGAEAKQEWGGEMDYGGRVNWTRRW